MNREIKFRAWDVYKSEMLSGDKGDVDAFWFANLPMNLAIEQAQRQCSLVLMQFTGLKDEEGKEIYEGDIIKVKQYDYRGDICTTTGVVFWDDKNFSYRIHGYREYKWFMYNDTIEVIGNIYENPELLKEK